MKTMTCKQLGGACDMQFRAETFDEMALLSQKHGQQMAAQSDIAHLKAMEKMKQLMDNPNAMQHWMNDLRGRFDNLPNQ